MSIHWAIIRRLLTHPSRVAVIDDRRAYRGGELLVAALHVASRLRARCESRAVGILLPTSGAFPIAALGAWFAGKVIVPLNYLLKREELEYVIRDCGTDSILAARPMIEFMTYEPRGASLHYLEDIDFRSIPEPVWPAPAAAEDLAVLLYTSGTSGKPKGVMLSHGNIAANIQQVLDYIEITPRDSILGVLPQFHSFGLTVLTLMPLAAGPRAVYTARFVPHKIIKLLREHRPSIFIAIPSMYNALLSVKDASPDDFASLRLIVSGGEPLPRSTFDAFRQRFGVTLNEGYGLTETAPVSNWCRPDEWRPGSVGRAMPGLVQRIIDPATGAPLPPHHDGEVQMRGPNIMQGYFHLPDETAAVFTPDGFLKTGDMGRLDDDGHLFITGRIKEMLIVGGENVFPREIEEVLNKHESIAASGVVGLADPLRGELPVAFVELREGASFDEAALKRWCRQHLAGYKVPDQIRVLDQLPRNPTGKIMRRELKKLLPHQA
ncbi:MAG: long-chain-fatty-acid--CoA ligase [Phycisphaerae bacterium]|nr:MAG: long-chain-fatty-acid--CoA ligase [Phycisphaerae bacterium]